MLNDKQRKIVEDNMGLVGAFISRLIRENKLTGPYLKDLEDWHSIFTISLIKAVLAHDVNRGKLSTLFYSIARNDYYHERRKSVDLVGIDDSIECMEYYGYNDLGYLKQVIMSQLDEREQVIVNMLAEGSTHAEIARHLGLTTSRVTQIVRDIRERLEEVVE